MKASRRAGSLFFAAAFLFSVGEGGLSTGAGPAPAKTLVDAAVAQSAAQNKVAFIHFSASW